MVNKVPASLWPVRRPNGKSNQSYSEILQRAEIVAELGIAQVAKKHPSYTLRQILNNFCNRANKRSLALVQHPILEKEFPVRAGDVDGFGELKEGAGKEILKRAELKELLMQLLGEENGKPIIGSHALKLAIHNAISAEIIPDTLPLDRILELAGIAVDPGPTPPRPETSSYLPDNYTNLFVALRGDHNDSRIYDALIDFGHSMAKAVAIPDNYAAELANLIAAKIKHHRIEIVKAAAYALSEFGETNAVALTKLFSLIDHPETEVRWRAFKQINNSLISGATIDQTAARYLLISLGDPDLLIRARGIETLAALLKQSDKLGFQNLTRLVGKMLTTAKLDELAQTMPPNNSIMEKIQKIAQYVTIGGD